MKKTSAVLSMALVLGGLAMSSVAASSQDDNTPQALPACKSSLEYRGGMARTKLACPQIKGGTVTYYGSWAPVLYGNYRFI